MCLAYVGFEMDMTLEIETADCCGLYFLTVTFNVLFYSRVVPVLAAKASGVGGIATLILNLDTKWT